MTLRCDSPIQNDICLVEGETQACNVPEGGEAVAADDRVGGRTTRDMRAPPPVQLQGSRGNNIGSAQLVPRRFLLLSFPFLPAAPAQVYGLKMVVVVLI